MDNIILEGVFRNKNLCQHVSKGLTLIPVPIITSEQTKTVLTLRAV